MQKKISPLFWPAVFGGIFLLTQTGFFPSMPTKLWWPGLPNWLYVAMSIHLLFLVALYFFAKKQWK